MASPASALLVPILSDDLDSNQSQHTSVLASCGVVRLHEGCQTLGRDLFPADRAPHVSRQHLRLDVRLHEVEVTVVSFLAWDPADV